MTAQAQAQQPPAANPPRVSTPDPTQEATPEPTPEPTAPPTEPPSSGGGAYCARVGSDLPPNSVIGTLTIAGQPAPAGTVVSLAFDGVPGPGRPTTTAGGYRVDYNAAGSDCANRVGAAITVIVNGQAFPAGRVGDGTPIVANVAVP